MLHLGCPRAHACTCCAPHPRPHVAMVCAAPLPTFGASAVCVPCRVSRLPTMAWCMLLRLRTRLWRPLGRLSMRMRCISPSCRLPIFLTGKGGPGPKGGKGEGREKGGGGLLDTDVGAARHILFYLSDLNWPGIFYHLPRALPCIASLRRVLRQPCDSIIL